MSSEEEIVFADTRNDLLLRIADAEAAIRPDRDTFMVARGLGMTGVIVQHRGLPAGFRARNYADIEDLAERGLIRPRYGPHGINGFDVTDEGLRQATLLRAAASPSTPSASRDQPLEWQDRVLPVLEAINHIYGQADPALGLRLELLADEIGVAVKDEELGRVVYELCQTGYLKATMEADQMLAPLFFRLEEKALKVVAGWPTEAGADLFARLLVILDDRIASARSPEERSKWERFRDGVVGVGRDVASDVLSALATGAVRGIT